MERTEFIILPEFITIVNGLEYLETNKIKFSFSVNNETYSSDGVQISTPNNSEIIPINDIYIDIYENPQPGQLYVEDDYLKYYKEN